jgi:tetrahydromethanopterin S-methyltransferase subunit F
MAQQYESEKTAKDVEKKIDALKILIDDVKEKLNISTKDIVALKLLIDNLKILIDAIEDKLDSSTFGLEEIKNEIIVIDGLVDDIIADIVTIDGVVDGIAADIGVFPTANYATLAAYVEDIRTRLTTILADIITIAGYLDTEIQSIIDDIGVFPTANYATLAAYVEDIRTRLIAILAATATLITSVVPKATDEQGTVTWVTLTHGTNEFDISSLFTTPLTGTTRRKYSIFLDLTGPAGDAAAWTICTINVKIEVDGANARNADQKEVAKADVQPAKTPIINIDIPSLAKDCQITLQFDVALAGDATIYYHYVTEVLE